MPKLKPPFKLNVPMLLTWMRIAMIPLVIGIFYLPETWMTMGTKNATAMLMFVIAAITDALDGPPEEHRDGGHLGDGLDLAEPVDLDGARGADLGHPLAQGGDRDLAADAASSPAAIRAGPRPWAPSSIPSPTSSS